MLFELNQIVYFHDWNTGDEIQSATYEDVLRMYAEETTTPRGCAPIYHTRGNELWTWGPSGQFPRRVAEFESEAEAETELLELFERQLADKGPAVHATREEAEAERAEALA